MQLHVFHLNQDRSACAQTSAAAARMHMREREPYDADGEDDRRPLRYFAFLGVAWQRIRTYVGSTRSTSRAQ